jgi:hypothetical protein
MEMKAAFPRPIDSKRVKARLSRECNRLLTSTELPNQGDENMLRQVSERQAQMGRWSVVLLGLSMTAALPQTPPSSKPSLGVTSVPAALKSIQDQVNAQGEIKYTMISKSTGDGRTVEDHYTVETSHALIHPSSCSMEVDAKMTMNASTQRLGRVAILFRPITGIAVKSQTEAINEQSARAGVNAWTGKITPESYMVQTFHSGTLSGILFFREQGTAEEVAKAIGYVVEQCGGAKVTF